LEKQDTRLHLDSRQNCGNQAITTKPNFTIVGVYAPIEGKEQETEEFYNELQVIDKIPKKGKHHHSRRLQW
jgi:hypothetical protein